MWMVVDSGSTKADWILVENDKKTLISTMGLNPYFHGPERVQAELSKPEFTSLIPVNNIKNIFYYGAGCPDETYRGRMKEGLKLAFPNAMIDVHHDLLGAARATCGKEPGICGILGTGSNSCLYDGKNIIDNVPALAHVLGDEGGGVFLGKLILQSYFYRELPLDLLHAFEQSYPEGGDAIIHRIYGEGQNVHIASFAEFVIKHKEHPFARQLIEKSFLEFINRHLKKYENWDKLPINLVGSIAGLLTRELKETLESQGMKLGRVVRKPIDSLVEYHFSEMRL